MCIRYVACCSARRSSGQIGYYIVFRTHSSTPEIAICNIMFCVFACLEPSDADRIVLICERYLHIAYMKLIKKIFAVEPVWIEFILWKIIKILFTLSFKLTFGCKNCFIDWSKNLIRISVMFWMRKPRDTSWKPRDKC